MTETVSRWVEPSSETVSINRALRAQLDLETRQYLAKNPSSINFNPSIKELIDSIDSETNIFIPGRGAGLDKNGLLVVSPLVEIPIERQHPLMVNPYVNPNNERAFIAGSNTLVEATLRLINKIPKYKLPKVIGFPAGIPGYLKPIGMPESYAIKNSLQEGLPEDYNPEFVEFPNNKTSKDDLESAFKYTQTKIVESESKPELKKKAVIIAIEPHIYRLTAMSAGLLPEYENVDVTIFNAWRLLRNNAEIQAIYNTRALTSTYEAEGRGLRNVTSGQPYNSPVKQNA